jgi:hypothetical protein
MHGPICRISWAAALVVCFWPGRLPAADVPVARPVAPGVLTVFPAEPLAGETATGPVAIVEIVVGMPDLDWTPNFAPKSDTLREKAQKTVFRRTIWCFEFACKPMRMIEVDVPQPSGKMQRKKIWYLVYRIRNNGYDLKPVGTEDRWGQTLYDNEAWDIKTLRFFPHLVLRSLEFDKEYLDRVIPAAQRAIQERENPGVKLHNSVEMASLRIPVTEEGTGRGYWGVATWEDVDPRIDFFSVFVGGLTNAFQFEDVAGAFKPGDPPGTGRVFRRKKLQLNYWRPGDPVMEHEKEIRFGTPIDPDPAIQQQILDKYGLKERLDYLWVYR